ncbi:MAG: SPFH domain-containing protein [Planctomycetota bacterium]|nr:SPFH domain-containing protein [Planctomycetota bacterium]MDG1986323.1 SPFH domain-containing protein [Planctomycetota bacterium]
MFQFPSISPDALYYIGAAVLTVIRASGVTVKSGNTGLIYTVGRVDRGVPRWFRPALPLVRKLPFMSGCPRQVLEPGFHPMIPFLQQARHLPTRSRTLDLPAQRVATPAGHVFIADANIVYRVVDIRRALIQVDDLVRGMKQMLTLGVQEVLRDAPLAQLQSGIGLDQALRDNLERKLEAWGVTVERAGFPTITPSPMTLRITQLGHQTEERQRQLLALTSQDGAARTMGAHAALGTVGTRRFFRTKARARRRAAVARREHLRLRASLERRGWTGAAIERELRRIQPSARP